MTISVSRQRPAAAVSARTAGRRPGLAPLASALLAGGGWCAALALLLAALLAHGY